jgi:single-strand DNA-binding protein
MSFNSVVAIGRAAGTPELRYSSTGVPTCSFSIVMTRRMTVLGGERASETTSIDVVVHRRLAEICAQFIRKGREILVMGTLGQAPPVAPLTQRTRLEVVAQTVQFLGQDKPRRF